jgi:hypothetical protein
MSRSLRFTLAIAALFAGVASPLWAIEQPTPCAEYITSGLNDAPQMGSLIGSETVTRSGSIILRWLGFTVSETFEVGTYQMGDGSRQTFNCSNYTSY